MIKLLISLKVHIKSEKFCVAFDLNNEIQEIHFP